MSDNQEIKVTSRKNPFNLNLPPLIDKKVEVDFSLKDHLCRKSIKILKFYHE